MIGISQMDNVGTPASGPSPQPPSSGDQAPWNQRTLNTAIDMLSGNRAGVVNGPGVPPPNLRTLSAMRPEDRETLARVMDPRHWPTLLKGANRWAANLRSLSLMPNNVRKTQAQEMDPHYWRTLLADANYRAANLRSLSVMPNNVRETLAQQMDPENCATLLEDANPRAAQLRSLSAMRPEDRETPARVMDPENWATLLEYANYQDRLLSLSQLPDEDRKTRAQQMDPENCATLLKDADDLGWGLSLLNASNLSQARRQPVPRQTLIHGSGQRPRSNWDERIANLATQLQSNREQTSSRSSNVEREM
jgi:isochorismate synthase EntC